MKFNETYVIVNDLQDKCFVDFELYFDLEQLKVKVKDLNNNWNKRNKPEIENFEYYSILPLSEAIDKVAEISYDLGRHDELHDLPYYSNL